MIRILVLYPRAAGARFDFDCGAPMGMHYSVDRGIGTLTPVEPSPFAAVALVTFPAQDVIGKYLEKHGTEILGDIPNYTDIQPVFHVSDIAL